MGRFLMFYISHRILLLDLRVLLYCPKYIFGFSSFTLFCKLSLGFGCKDVFACLLTATPHCQPLTQPLIRFCCLKSRSKIFPKLFGSCINQTSVFLKFASSLYFVYLKDVLSRQHEITFPYL